MDKKIFFSLISFSLLFGIANPAVSAPPNPRPHLDIVLLFDHSYSMFEDNDARMYEAQAAANNFIDHLDPSYDRVALVRFSEYAEVNKPLGTPFSDVKNKIDSYHLDYFSKFTNLEKALAKAREELTSRGRTEADKIIILLSDGHINRPRLKGREDLEYARSLALAEAKSAALTGITIHTVTLGKDNVDQQLLQGIAERTGGKNYIAVSPIDLIPIYEDIAIEVTEAAEPLRLPVETDQNSETEEWNSSPNGFPLPSPLLTGILSGIALVIIGHLIWKIGFKEKAN